MYVDSTVQCVLCVQCSTVRAVRAGGVVGVVIIVLFIIDTNMIRTISKYMCKQTALATTRTMFQLSWDKNASLSIQHPIQPSTPISPTPSLIRDD